MLMIDYDIEANYEAIKILFKYNKYYEKIYILFIYLFVILFYFF